MANQSEGQTVMVQGRIVWAMGDLFKGQIKTEFGSSKPVVNDKGEQVREYGFGLAVPKSILGQPGDIWEIIHTEAYKIYPNGIPQGFSMKYKDGDNDVDQNGQPYSQREGYAGCLVFACTTRIPIKWFKLENGANVMVNEGIKVGDFVTAQLHIKGHGAVGQGKPGLYINPRAAQFLAFGKEIINAPSGDDIFGQKAPEPPQWAQAMGASEHPVAPQSGQLVPEQPMGQGQQQPQQPQGMPAPGGQPQAPQQPQGMPTPPSVPGGRQ